MADIWHGLGAKHSSMRRELLEWARKVTLAFIIVIALAIVYVSARALEVLPRSPLPTTAVTHVSPVTALPAQNTHGPTEDIPPMMSSTPRLPTSPPTTEGPAAVRIGIVAGHHENDSGAVCPDGLREADINLAVAERVVGRLNRKEYSVDLLSEFDDKILGYKANVFLSIHADSCIPGLSGFKIARSGTSAIPEIEDQLVQDITTSYAEKTGLAFHANSISEHMRDYHAFRKIAQDTPGAIIELGFMSDDRNILLYRQDRLARGLVDGIQVFLNSQN